MNQESFEQMMTASIQQSVLRAPNPQQAAATALDILLVNCFMLVGCVEKGCKGKNAIHRIVNRLERLDKMIKEGEKKAKAPQHVEGDPVHPDEVPKLVDFSVKGKSRIIRPPGYNDN